MADLSSVLHERVTDICTSVAISMATHVVNLFATGESDTVFIVSTIEIA